MSDQVCVISGVGPGTGSALAKRFAEGSYRVALLARSESRLASLEQELAGCVYRKLKHGRSGDEVRPGWRVN